MSFSKSLNSDPFDGVIDWRETFESFWMEHSWSFVLFTWIKIQGKQSGSSVALGLAKSHDSSSYFNPSKSVCEKKTEQR